MAALLAGALAGGCGSSPPTDKNFGTNLGADFRAPIVDAASDGDTNVTPEASADGAGSGGTAGAGGAAGTGGTTSTGGTTGSDAGAGSAGQTGAGGNAGAAGGGS